MKKINASQSLIDTGKIAVSSDVVCREKRPLCSVHLGKGKWN